MEDLYLSAETIGHDDTTFGSNHGDKLFTNDPNPEFQDVQNAVRKFDEMRITSGKARAALRLLSAPGLQLTGDMWVETEKEVVKPKDKKIENYVKEMFLEPPSKRFPKKFTMRGLLEDMYLSLCYGFFDFEKTIKVNDKGEYYY